MNSSSILFKGAFHFYNLVGRAMSWLIVYGYFANISFLDSHVMYLQVHTRLDIFMVSTMLKRFQDLARIGIARFSKIQFTG